MNGAVKEIFEGPFVEPSGTCSGPGRVVFPREPGIRAAFRNVSIVRGPNRIALNQGRGARLVDDTAISAATLEHELAVPDRS